MKQNLRIIGIMSGTSIDAIDIAIVRFQNNQTTLEYFTESPMPFELKESILRLAEPGFDEIDRMGSLDRQLGVAFAKAALNAISDAKLTLENIDAIACHGQTIRHRPKGIGGGSSFTLQIGCAATIAEHTGLTTITDFRRRDIAAQGEGAPLVPFAHQVLFGKKGQSTAVVNIGGISNISYLGKDGEIFGFDSGPGNMIMDALMLALSDGRNAYDKDGSLAASGNICQPLLDELLKHPYFKRTPPKSTGREAFGADIVDQILSWKGVSDAVRLATACELTALSIVQSKQWLAESPQLWLICGGGTRNAHLMARLRFHLAPVMLNTTEAYGIPPQAVEAVSFAILAKNTLLGEPNTLAAVTGATHNVIGGVITPGNNYFLLSTSN